MQSRRQTPAQITLALMRLSTSGRGFAEIVCPHCDVSLDWDQPDSDDPDRLLGICRICRLWFVMDLVSESDQAVILIVPKSDGLRQSARD